MIVGSVDDVEDRKIESYPYKGQPIPVKNVWIRWLSRVGPAGAPEYGLRFFTLGPGGEVPIHKHFYHQTMYILSGRVRCFRHDPDTDEIVEEKVLGANDFIFIPTMEVHSMRNESEREPATFLCCIANVYEGKTV